MAVPQEVLNELLRWSIQHSDPEVLAQNASAPPQQIDRDVMDAMFANDDPNRMKLSIDLLNNPDTSFQKLMVAFEELEFLCESIDNANDLDTLGGIDAILNIIQKPHSSDLYELAAIRRAAAWVLAAGVQNNPKFQKVVFRKGILGLFLHILKTETFASVRNKLLFMISGMVCTYKRAALHLVEQGGLDMLADVIAMPPHPDGDTTAIDLSQEQEETVRCIRRIAFFLGAMLRQYEDEASLSTGVCQKKLPLILLEAVSKHPDDIEMAEHTMNMLVALARSEHGLAWMKDDSSGFVDALKHANSVVVGLIASAHKDNADIPDYSRYLGLSREITQKVKE